VREAAALDRRRPCPRRRGARLAGVRRFRPSGGQIDPRLGLGWSTRQAWFT